MSNPYVVVGSIVAIFVVGYFIALWLENNSNGNNLS